MARFLLNWKRFVMGVVIVAMLQALLAFHNYNSSTERVTALPITVQKVEVQNANVSLTFQKTISRESEEKLRLLAAKMGNVLSLKAHPFFKTWPSRPDQLSLCDYYNNVGQAKRIVIENLLQVQPPGKDRITIVTQARLRQNEQFVRLANGWYGPISIALHIQPGEIEELDSTLIEIITNTKKRHLMFLHLVFDLFPMTIFPVNYLRNVALNATDTDRVLLLDVQGLTSLGLYKHIANTILNEDEALLVMTLGLQDEKMLPKAGSVDYEFMIQAWQLGLLTLHSPMPGNNSTYFKRWTAWQQRHQVEFSSEFEPFVVVRRAEILWALDAPLMDENLDRLSYFLRLKKAGYKLFILPKGFIFRHEQPFKQQEKDKYYKCYEALWNATIRDLDS